MECSHCKNDLEPGRTTYTANRHGYHLRLDDIPAVDLPAVWRAGLSSKGSLKRFSSS